MIEPALKEIHEQTDLSITDTQFFEERALNSLGLHHSQAENSIKTAKTAILAFLSKNRRNPYQHRKTA